MFDIDNWREIVNVIGRNRLRTLLTAAGVFWGIFILIVMLGFGNGIEDGVVKNMTGYASNGYYIWGRKTSVPWQGLTAGRRVRLNNDDTQAIVSNISGIQYLAPRIQLDGHWSRTDVTHGTAVTDSYVIGDVPEFKHVLPMTIETGRFINQFDIEQKRKVVVIGTKVHQDLFGDKDPIGKSIKIKQVNFVVIGVFKPKKLGSDRERISATVFLPFTTFQQVFNYGKRLDYFSLIPEEGISARSLGEKVRLLLAARHRVSPQDSRAFGSWNSESEFLKIRNLFWGIRTFIWTVGIATLFAGILGVSNIMLIVIKERTREFGLRKALGATPASIIAMITQETLVLTGLSGILGLMSGVLTLRLVDSLTHSITTNPDKPVMFSAPTIDGGIALVAIAVLVIAGVIAAIIPARQAVAVDPVVALKAE